MSDTNDNGYNTGDNSTTKTSNETKTIENTSTSSTHQVGNKDYSKAADDQNERGKQDSMTSANPHESETSNRISGNIQGDGPSTKGIIEKSNVAHQSVDVHTTERENTANTSATNSLVDSSHVMTTARDDHEMDYENASSTRTDSHCYNLDDESIYYRNDEPDLLGYVWEHGSNEKLLDRILGCAYGQALGDAYGLSTEFETREDVAYTYPDASKLIPYPNYILTGHSRRWTRGDWTDDTDQWILILETLTETNHEEPDEIVFAKKLTTWIRHGYPELGDYAGMGLGANVAQVVHSHNYHTDPLGASEAVWERSNCQAAPNGAVMRCSAVAFVHYKDRDKVIEKTELLCKTTHFDPRCIASCLAVCLAIIYMLKEDFDPNDIESLIKCVQNETIDILGDRLSEEHRKLFLWYTDRERTLEDLNLDEPRSIGYTYKCLGSGFYGLRSTRSFQETLNDLIRYGGDADTNGAVCGTLYGTRHGYKGLPYEWLRAMPYKRWFDLKLIHSLDYMELIK